MALPTARPRWNRVAFAAAHVVADPRANVDPWLAAAIDWDATLAYRRYLWAQGFGVAEAMDTAQRGMGLDWPTSLELIGRTVAESRGVAGRRRVFRAPAPTTSRRIRTASIERVIDAYAAQCAAIEARRRPHHPDGEPRARRVRTVGRRLRARLLARAGAMSSGR